MKIVSRLLVRAPLLPIASRLDSTPLGALAVRLASPSLATAIARGLDDRARASLYRYEARARFRATPHGLLAGVGVAAVGETTAIDTGAPEPSLRARYAVLAAEARAKLDEPGVKARFRVAPSLLRHGDTIAWLARDGRMLEADLDDALERVLQSAARWRALPIDDLVLQLVDDGLLHSELEPPLVGPPPPARDETAEPDTVHATLVFPSARVTVARTALERAAALVPTLVRLAQALAPPTAERDLDPGLAASAALVEERFGPGALDLGAFALGGYGVRPDEAAEPAARASPPTALLTLLVDRIVSGAAGFTAAELDAVLPPAPIPATVELMLAPRQEPTGAPPGTGWLLGWHAPAGATWGRFAHALPGLHQALVELAEAEPEGRLDVAFAPSPELADLAMHPPIRRKTLAISGWPAGAAVTAGELELVPGVGLQGGTPAPLTRFRSTTAPPGIFQLLVGWSLNRQHAPWALVLGPLAELAAIPRVTIDGFVVAPASWRLPRARDAETLATWRLGRNVPRWVQIGHEDELLPVDLDAPDAIDLLQDSERVTEIWPPLDELPLDASGRRVELVAAVVLSEEEPAPRRPRIEPDQPPEEGWRSFTILGPRAEQDGVLLGTVAPAIEAARARGEIDGWFFLRYLEGARHELRVRVHGKMKRLAGATEGPYYAERARYGKALPAVLRAFEASSDAALALLEEDDRDLFLVRLLDGLARGLGLDRSERLALAGELRAAFDEPEGAREIYRAMARRLRDALENEADARVKKLVRSVGKGARALAPDLCHLLVNRVIGIDSEREAFAYIAWQRTLEGLRFGRSPRSASGRLTKSR